MAWPEPQPPGPTTPRALLGQVFTPAPLADLTLSLALETWVPDATVLDPACGDGVFLARAVARGLAPSQLVGVDLDPVAMAAARAQVPDANLELGDWFARPLTQYGAVVGNPPYVRQERLGPGKGRVAKVVMRDTGIMLGARTDLAIAFTVRATAALAPGARLAFVLSQAILDAGYGAGLREALGASVHLRAIVASPDERWFPDAALHAAIVVLERAREPGAAPPVCFAALRVPVAVAAERVRGLADLDAVADVRMVPAAVAATVPWGPLLRAPDAWHAFAAEAGPALTTLGALAEVRRGMTTGANAFFYVPAGGDHGIEDECLQPVLRAERGPRPIAVDALELPERAFVAGGPERELPPGARAWIAGHERLAANPTLAARRCWWALVAQPSRVFLAKAYDARFVQRLASAPVLCDQRLYALTPMPGLSPDLLAAVLNATPTALAIESLGRASMGEGALELAVSDAMALPVLDPRGLDAAGAVRLRAALASLARRPIGPVDDEVEREDRAVLDAAALGAWPSLLAMAPALRAALASSVGRRLRRARG